MLGNWRVKDGREMLLLDELLYKLRGSKHCNLWVVLRMYIHIIYIYIYINIYSAV